ncbi:16S rRNA (cytidine(1402)-2'-O)-methyltransferase [Simkania negevensis]|uniref:Ribosomal RNA small subunit methyltransferase I n=1 Tax=Simkania negevensis TaxID=83561 RepID=A0ABS3ATA9_9BACT|nr:16S rRNA (cytidine(1402)-2'-O)-methyltransferase [Simkania negevensis]
MSGTLYLVATPIGNLEDITLRALSVLKECSAVLCEDTRRAGFLLNHYGIKKPLLSYHKFNESRREEEVFGRLLGGEDLALVSDAGTPGINDPGVRLVDACRCRQIPVVPLPGACSPIVALAASGFPTAQFQCVGFLPKKGGARRKVLEAAVAYSGTTICFESPYRLCKTLAALVEVAPDCMVGVGRELTKKFEEHRRGTSQELLDYYTDKPPKGEIVLLIAPGKNAKVNKKSEGNA